MKLQNPRGTKDLLPEEAEALAAMVKVAAELFARYGYRLIATPTFEYSDVFVRGIGQATDVVGKEMFNVLSLDATRRLESGEPLRSEEKLALRPEGTAGIARAAVQHSLVTPTSASGKYWYFGPMYRHERPQKGRLREFHQIGAECLGAGEPSADAEMIEMLMRYYQALGIGLAEMTLKINSMGCDDCRPAYRQQVRDFLLNHASQLCQQCIQRADTNPLRAFDCKNPKCQEVLAQAPKITSTLCGPCQEHYADLKSLLRAAELDFVQDPRLVRGLDYYTRSVFEVQVQAGLGAQNAIGGGGRYDKLLAEFGAKPTPGLGFAVGLERTRLVLEALSVAPPAPPALLVFVAAVDDASRSAAFNIASRLRGQGISTELDHQRRSLKSQVKLADKLQARYCLIAGPEEITKNRYKLRSMAEHREESLTLDEIIATLQTLPVVPVTPRSGG